MNLPHGDQIQQLAPAPVLAVQESHEEGTPVTTLAVSDPICWLYNF